MIAYIRGELAEKEPTRVVIEAAGVGYELLIPLSTYDRLPREGGEVKLLAFHCVREDDEIRLPGRATGADPVHLGRVGRPVLKRHVDLPVLPARLREQEPLLVVVPADDELPRARRPPLVAEVLGD